MRAFVLRMAAVVAVIGLALMVEALLAGNLALLGGIMLLPAALMGTGWLLRRAARDSRRRVRRAQAVAARHAAPVHATGAVAVYKQAAPVKRPPLHFPPDGPKAA